MYSLHILTRQTHTGTVNNTAERNRSKTDTNIRETRKFICFLCYTRRKKTRLSNLDQTNIFLSPFYDELPSSS